MNVQELLFFIMKLRNHHNSCEFGWCYIEGEHTIKVRKFLMFTY